MELTTLCYIEKEDSYLMLHRISEKNDVHKDKWIGVGGHFEVGESPEDCLLREVKEETGLTLTSYRFRGILTFLFNENEAEYICLYTADEFEGEMKSCDEGTLEWVPKNKIAELNLWEAGNESKSIVCEKTVKGDVVFLSFTTSPFTVKRFLLSILCSPKSRLPHHDKIRVHGK